MDPRDDDIQFDFFEDEPRTTEAQGSRVRIPGRGGRGGGRSGGGLRRPAGPPRGLTPILRLLALIAIVVAVLVAFGLLLQSCASTSKHSQYSTYVGKVATIAHGSADDGAAVASALITPGAKAAEIATKLRGIADQERQNVAAAQKISVPGPMRNEHQQLVEALQLRVSGVQGLADTFANNPTSKADSESSLLAEQADRLLASDVVWDDLYLAPAVQELKRQGVSGVQVPESHFVANRDLVTERSMSALLTRLRGTSTGGTVTGVHGTNIADVKALPGNKALTSGDNTVIASTATAFVVGITDSGDSQEVGIKVTLTIQKSSGGKALVVNKTLDLINPGQTKTVTFSGLALSPYIGTKATVSVDVATVQGEKNPNNNKASFSVFFSI